MRRYLILGLLVLCAFDTLAQVSFKLAAQHTIPVEPSPAWFLRLLAEIWLYLALIGYVGAFFTYLTLLKRMPIGQAFAASHLEVVTVVIVSVLFLGERLSLWQLAGGALVLAGIWLLAETQQANHPGDAASPAARKVEPATACLAAAPAQAQCEDV